MVVVRSCKEAEGWMGWERTGLKGKLLVTMASVGDSLCFTIYSNIFLHVSNDKFQR